MLAYVPRYIHYRGKTIKIEHRRFHGTCCKKKSKSSSKDNKKAKTGKPKENSIDQSETMSENEELIKKKNVINNFLVKTMIQNKFEGRIKKKGQNFHIDGEDLVYDDFVKFECIQGAIEIIVDYDFIMKDQ